MVTAEAWSTAIERPPVLGKYTGPAVPDAFGSWTRMKVLFFRGGYKSPLGCVCPRTSVPRPRKTGQPFRCAPLRPSAERNPPYPTVKLSVRMGHPAPWCWFRLLGKRKGPGVSRAFSVSAVSSLEIGTEWCAGWVCSGTVVPRPRKTGQSFRCAPLRPSAERNPLFRD